MRIWFIPIPTDERLWVPQEENVGSPFFEPLRRLLDDLLKVRKTEFSVAIDTRPGPRLVFKGGCYR
jgi:hypothetical protein